MQREVVAWLEQGLTRAFDYLGLETPTTAVQAQVVALLPPVAGLARLWGAVDPARANGVAAAVANPLLRAAARAAAVEFAPWPPAMLQGFLRLAERDLRQRAWAEQADPALLADLVEELAVAWARLAPAELAAVGLRLRGAGGESALWRQRILDRAAARQLLPAELLPGGPADWMRQAHFALTAAQRARACLALAAAAWRREQAMPDAT